MLFGVKTLLQRLLNSNSNANGHTDHGVVTCAQEAHHLHVGGDGGRAGELSVTVHTAHGIGQAIGSGASCHVVGVQSTAVPPPEATEKYLRPVSMHSFL